MPGVSVGLYKIYLKDEREELQKDHLIREEGRNNVEVS